MSYVDDLRDLIAEHVREAEAGLDKIDRYGPQAVRTAVDITLPTIPRPPFVNDRLAGELIARLHEAVAEARQNLDLLLSASRYLGSPDTLRAAADRLSRDVALASDELAIDVRRDNLDAMLPSNWDDGDASAQYAISFEGQSDAVLKIRQNGLLLVDALRSMADGIERYYYELAKAAVSTALAVAGVVVAIVTAPSGVGAVAGVIGAIIALASAVLSVIELVEIAATDRGKSFRDHISTLRWPTTTFAAS